jgi:hypothetical protein
MLEIFDACSLSTIETYIEKRKVYSSEPLCTVS